MKPGQRRKTNPEVKKCKRESFKAVQNQEVLEQHSRKGSRGKDPKPKNGGK